MLVLVMESTVVRRVVVGLIGRVGRRSLVVNAHGSQSRGQVAQAYRAGVAVNAAGAQAAIAVAGAVTGTIGVGCT